MKKKHPNKQYKIKMGENILYWRKLKGLKQDDLAARIGISTAALSNIENGISKPDIERLEDIADALGIEVTQLLHNPQQMLTVQYNRQSHTAGGGSSLFSGTDKELLHRFTAVMEIFTRHLMGMAK